MHKWLPCKTQSCLTIKEEEAYQRHSHLNAMERVETQNLKLILFILDWIGNMFVNENLKLIVLLFIRSAYDFFFFISSIVDYCNIDLIPWNCIIQLFKQSMVYNLFMRAGCGFLCVCSCSATRSNFMYGLENWRIKG